MQLEQEARAKIADLQAQYGERTLIQAHIEAYQAVLIKDVSKCRLWHRVIELLEVNQKQ